MLKSHFNINQPDEEEEETPEITLKARKPRKTPERNSMEEQQGEEIEVEEVEPKIHVPEKKLNRSDVSVRLSLLGKTADGDGYTYLKATLTGLSLTNINTIKFFRHLQFVDLSNNRLELDSLQVVTELPSLVLIHADHNLLTSAALNKAKYLQVIIFNNNYLTSVEDVFQTELSTLEVGNNKITTIHFAKKMSKIRCLDFRNNLVEHLLDLDFPLLDSLYVAGNKIKSLVGIKALVNLRILHVRNNPIRLLDGFDTSLKKLQYVNLRNCKVSTLKQVKKLRDLPALDTLILKGCPYMGGTGNEDADVAQEEEDNELRVEVIATIPRLKRLNKALISPEERTEANDLRKIWLEEGEKEDEQEVEEEIEPEENNTD